jgi:hypothetical protein
MRPAYEDMMVTASCLLLVTLGLLALMLSTSGCMGIQAPVGLTGLPKIDIPVTQPPNNFYENPSAVRVPATQHNATNITGNITGNVTTIPTTKPKFLYV